MDYRDYLPTRKALAPAGIPSIARAILQDARQTTSTDKQRKEDYLKEKFEIGGRPFVERVRKYGATEGGDRIILTPWLEELLEGIGDFRLGHTITMACSQLSKSLSHILLANDIQCNGRLVFAYVYDRKQSLENMQGSQFRPCLNYWLEAMETYGITFDRTRDVIKSTRCMVGGVNSVFTYASTSDQNLRDGKSAVGSAAASFKADVVFLEERSQYPPGAADIFYRRLDYSAVDTKPIRELSTPGAGGGIETETKNVDYYFYPHAECDNCGHIFPLDAYGCLLKKFLRTDAYGQQTEAYVSESNRPVEWFYKDPNDPVQTAYFACPHCHEELGEETRINSRFKCLKTGQWFRDVVDSLPKGIPDKRIKAVFGYGPLLRKSKINLAADLIRNGLEMVDPADWIQQGLGHPSEAGSSVLTIPVLKRAIDAPPAERLPEIRLAGVDQGRGSYWLTIADISLPENWKDLPVEVVIEKANRSIVFAGDVMVGALADKLAQYRVGYGFIDNEPNRTIAAELQRTTVLEMADQRSRLGDALKKSTVQEGGMDISCWLIRNEKFLMQTMLTFLLSDEDNNPLIRLPNDWTRWIANPSERSPLRHYMGVKYDPSTGDWIKTDPVNDLFYSLAFMEAALYSWLMDGAKDLYVLGTLATTKTSEDRVLGSFEVNMARPRRSRLRRNRIFIS